jgi:phospholipid/cholesterol/gamma-HCH transport system permease protein
VERVVGVPIEADATREGDRTVIRLRGALDAADLADAKRVFRSMDRHTTKSVDVVLPEGPLSARGAVVLEEICFLLERRGATVRVVPTDPSQLGALESHGGSGPRPQDGKRKEPFLARVVLGQRRIIEGTLGYFHVFRVTTFDVALALIGRRRIRIDDVLLSVIQMGRDALPLVAIIAGLIGAILALQAGPLFAQFGQQNRVAQLVGMSMMREIGPLLTAILVAGRSGSSLAAEIGTMKVAEEIDALTVMGSSPVRVLVAPRFIGLLIALPCLVMVADLIGIGGGLLVGVAVLEVPMNTYFEETEKAIKLDDVIGGLIKAAAFAVVTVTIAAQQGFATSGGAAGVGRNTTRSVVLSILWIIVVDAFFTYMLYRLEL